MQPETVNPLTRARDAIDALDQAVKRKQHARVGPLMRALGKLIADGAEADEVAEDLVRHVDRRAARAHRINELRSSGTRWSRSLS